MPYLLSNLLFVTESLTLIAGKSSSPADVQLVEAVHAGGGLFGHALDVGGDAGPAVGRRGERAAQQVEDDAVLVAVGTRRSRERRRRARTRGPCARAWWRRRRRRGSCSGRCSRRRRPRPRRTSRRSARCTTSTRRASRPSRRRPERRPGRRACPAAPTTIAAAASSWVEKMLQLAQRTCAPSAVRVSMSTAVCTVMCSDPTMRAPASGCESAELLAERHEPRHLVLGEADLVAAGLGEREVGDLEGQGGHRCGSRSHASIVKRSTLHERLLGELHVTHDLPALRGLEPLGVARAQVVAVRLMAEAQGAEHGERIGVDVCERGDGLVGARHTGTRSDSSSPSTVRPRRRPDSQARSCVAGSAGHERRE